MELIFATNNPHKINEIRSLAGERIRIFSLADIGLVKEIPEDFQTLEENARQKARFIHEITGMDCIADDTGLEVFSLNNEPGVYSARYSRLGDIQFPDMEIVEGNIHKLLLKLNGVRNRNAQFKTVISLILKQDEFLFEGIVRGTILKKKRGTDGFGYDPVFLPEGSAFSFAEMSLYEKNRISHRGKALEKLLNFLIHQK